MNSIKYIFLLALVVAMSSCIADLEEYNPSGDTADNIFTTEQGHTGLVNLCYSQLRKEFYGRENPVGLTMVGVDIWNEPPSKSYFPTAMYDDGKLEPTNTGLVKNCWERLYIPINNCNAAILRAPEANYSSDLLRNQRVAEARFLRAFYYWHIVEQWGGVALKMDETQTDVQYVYRSPVDSFYLSCILPDWEYAAATLPVEQADHGRATKAAAQGMLARMYLTYASYLKYFKNDAASDIYYEKAQAAADSIIGGRLTLSAATTPDAKYNTMLYPTPKEIFDQRNNKNNKEAMFIVGHSTNEALNPQATQANRLCAYFVSAFAGQDMGVKPENPDGKNANGYSDGMFSAPTKFLLNLYDEIKDARYAAFFKEVWYCNDSAALNATWTEPAVANFEKNKTKYVATGNPNYRTKLGFNMGDTAIMFTKKKVPNKADVKYAVRDIDDIYNEDGTFNTEVYKGIGNSNYFPQLLKYRDTMYATATTRNNAGRLDVIIMRLAEVYLIAAEAAFHLNKETDALAYVNVLRERAQVAGAASNLATASDVAAPNPDYGITGGYLDFILDERARELCGEHLRWFDLKRTKQLEKRLGVGKANPNVTLFKPEKHYLRPVPQTFLESIYNPQEFGQNPGY